MIRLLVICTAFWIASLQLRAAVAATPTSQPSSDTTRISSTQPVAVPYKLTSTNHILIRLKINGKGPFNFIVDTGSPVMILRVPAAQSLGLKPNARGMVTVKQLDIEGGLTLKRVQCMVDTPYQIEGMNAIGASDVELDGLLGYSVLARFRMQIDLSKDHMIWTPVNYIPPPFAMRRWATTAPADPAEDHLEAMGGLLKFLGPLVKPDDAPAKRRGMIGIELTETDASVSVERVLGDSPAEKAGVTAGDRILSVNNKPVQSIADAQKAMAALVSGKAVDLVVQRDQATINLHIISAEGL